MQISYTFHISSKQNAITTIRQLSKASKHNLRRYSSPGNETTHYDSKKIVQLAGTKNLFQDVENVYHEQFEETLNHYNNKQKRPDRRIPDYMRYISDNAKTDLAVEAIIQLGDMEFWESKSWEQKQQMVYIFKDQLRALNQYIPGFIIANAVVHFDEASPHMHVIGVPVASGYKRGMEKQTAKTKVFTKDTLENLQDLLRERAQIGMEKNPELFADISLKPKEQGRNVDFSKAFYVQTKKDELKETQEQISRRKEDLSDVKEQITEARETLTDVRTDLARSRSEAERIIEEANEHRKNIHLEEAQLLREIPFHTGDVFPVKGRQMRVETVYTALNEVSMRPVTGKAYEPSETFTKSEVLRAYLEYLFSGMKAEDLRRIQKETRAEEENVRKEKEQLKKLNEEVDVLTRHPLPFSSGDEFEYKGKRIRIVGVDYFDEKKVEYRDETGHRQSAPRIELVSAYLDYQKRLQLSRERDELEQEVEEISDKRRRLEKDFEECDTARAVFRRFPVIRDFVMEVGKRLRYFKEFGAKELLTLFREKVLGTEETIERSRNERLRR